MNESRTSGGRTSLAAPTVEASGGAGKMGKEMKTYALVGVAGLLMWAAGCSSIKRIDAQTFLQHGEDSTRMGSATSYDVIGISHDRAYIQYDTVVTLSGRPATYVYWIPLSELPTNIVTDLKAGMNPWPQWWKTHEKTNAKPEPKAMR